MIDNSGLSIEEESLIKRIAAQTFRKYCPEGHGNHFSREDLSHYGIIGLLEARASFDQAVGAPWLAFASIRVRGAMIDHLRKQPMIRLPQAVQLKVRELKQAGQALANKGVGGSPEQLAAELGWSTEEVHEVSGLSPVLVPVDDGGHYDGDDGYQGEILSSSEAGPEQRTMQAELAILINKCLHKLNPKSRLVVVGRLLEGLRLRELAATLGCTMENVRVRQKKSEAELKRCIEGHGLPVDALNEIIGH